MGWMASVRTGTFWAETVAHICSKMCMVMAAFGRYARAFFCVCGKTNSPIFYFLFFSIKN